MVSDKQFLSNLTIFPAAIMCLIAALMFAAGGNSIWYPIIAIIPFAFGVLLIWKKSRIVAIALLIIELVGLSYQIYLENFNIAKVANENLTGIIIAPLSLLAVYGTFKYHKILGTKNDRTDS